MNLSEEQSRALDSIRRWLDSDRPVFKLAGAAGTGKTSLVQYIAEGQKTIFAAPTGKAAKVLRDKGNPASTIHSLIYTPKEKSKMRLLDLEGQRADKLAADPAADVSAIDRQIADERRNLLRPAFSLNQDSDIRYADLVVIDEVSMVDQRTAEDLMSFGTKILVIGDPYQLPPVAGVGYFLQSEPDFLLEHIHRQAAESPIIRLATMIRQGTRPKVDGELVVPWGSVPPNVALSFDQIIVGRNKTRKSTNARVRALLGRATPLPVKGDRVVCLRNNHDLGLYNGGIWYVIDRVGEDDILDMIVSPDMDSSEEAEIAIPIHKHHFVDMDGEPIQQCFWERKEAEEFDYAWAITCHKAQGSQWDSVVVFDESSVFKDHALQWLYTAVTRAAKKLTLVVR